MSTKRRNQFHDEDALKAYLMQYHLGICSWCMEERGTDKHEIARGKYRSSCATRTCSTLLVGPRCHGILTRMASDDAERLGLAILRLRRVEDYDLAEHLRITTPHAPRRITAAEVDEWSRRITTKQESWA